MQCSKRMKTSTNVGSSHSFLLKCFGNIAWPTLEKFKSLMSTKRKNLIIQLSNYIKEAFSVRKNVLDIM